MKVVALLLVAWATTSACAGESSEVVARCAAASGGAEVVARRAGRLDKPSTEAAWVTTLREVEHAMGQPFQHRPSNPDEPVCLFVVTGSRNGDAVTGAIVLAPEDKEGETNLLGVFEPGDDPPSWVAKTRLTP